MADSLLGHELELDVGGPAAGGSCVARTGGPHGRVVFVRHALPGERVRAVVTEDRGGAFCRADAVAVLTASPERVEPPCPHAGPGRCGGCDWQHASGAAQRELKATVVRDQFARLAGLDLDDATFGGVEALPGGLLGWRTRIAYSVARDGRPGLLRHASHDVEVVGHCPLGVPGVGDSDVLARRWTGLRAVEVVAGDPPTVLGHEPAPRPRRGRGRRAPDRVTVLEGPDTVRREVAGRPVTLAATGFWQGHPHAADTFADALLAAVAPRPGERVLDLYAGAGALTLALATAVGPDGAVTGLEGDARAVADAAANLAPWPWAQVRHGRVTPAAVADLGAADVVVLDPPRAGAGAEVVAAIAAAAPRAVGYVSCDPATLARDVAALAGHGWRLAGLRAFDAYPMTHHVECVAALRPGSVGPRP